jgi:glycosyltransferase involved in cell wall biosynthesis
VKKHILFIVENAAVPGDRRVWPEAAVANKNFEKVSIISTVSRWSKKKYEIINGIEIYRHPVLKIGNKNFGLILEYLVAFLFELLLTAKIFLKKPFHIIHAANPPDHIFLIALFYKLFGIKFIFDHHDLSPELYLTKFSNKKDIIYKTLILFEKFSCKLADAVISTNNSYRRIVINRHKINRDKIFVARNDPKISEFSLNRKHLTNESNTKKTILYVGAINFQDGVDQLLYIIKYLIKELNRNNFICHVVGGGESLNSVENLSKKLGLKSFVNFTGPIIDRREVIKHLFSADICVEPAPDNEINRHSTFIKMMEYMAAGKPIVAFDLFETRYSTDNHAILIKSGDIEGFAHALKKLMDNPLLGERLGRSAQERIHSQLNWENSAQNLRRAYKYIST